MILGVVSDTHNRIDHVEKIIDIFNSNEVDYVVHTGDITQAKTLERFSRLECPLIVVYGNNDLKELGLKKVSMENGFNLQNPHFITTINGKKIAIFHEPNNIKEVLQREKNIELVLHGHTHKYRNESLGGTRIFNPGECTGMLKGKNAVGLVELENLQSKRIFF